MELSKYNVTSYVDSGIIVFNTLTSAIVKMSSEEWDIVRKGDLNNIPSEIASQLLCMGIITDKSDSQILQYKYEFYKNAFESKTPFLYVAPTMNCNFRCFYCFEEGHKHQATMTEETALKIVRFLKVQNKNEVNIVWFGGEPMLGFDLIMFLCRQLQNEGIDYTSSMITNGSLFTETNTKSLHLWSICQKET